MSGNFAVIGGDLRIIKLAQMLAQDKNIVYTYGLEKAEELKGKKGIIPCDKLSKAIRDAKIVISAVPFSSNGTDVNTPFGEEIITIRELIHESNGRILIAGGLRPDVYEMAQGDDYIEIIDIMKREELAVLNTISTAEGTIEIMISNTNRIIHGSEVLILGFGRVAKVLARKLSGLAAKITCAARKDEDFAWIKAYGHNSTPMSELGENLSKYDVIINTVPHNVMSKERIEHVKEDCLLIDLASNPGGIDRVAAKEEGLKLVWALALPGKVAPITSAEFIKDTVYNILKELYKK